MKCTYHSMHIMVHSSRTNTSRAPTITTAPSAMSVNATTIRVTTWTDCKHVSANLPTAYVMRWKPRGFQAFYPRDAILARVFARSTCPSVCPSVCHTPALSQNVMISSPSGRITILVFWCQISSQNSKGVTLSKGVKRGWGMQNKNFSSFERQYLENDARYVQSYY